MSDTLPTSCTIQREGWICADCLMVAANGPDDGGEYAPECLANAPAWTPAGYAEEPEDGPENWADFADMEFSNCECASCGDWRGGSRYWAVILG